MVTESYRILQLPYQVPTIFYPSRSLANEILHVFVRFLVNRVLLGFFFVDAVYYIDIGEVVIQNAISEQPYIDWNSGLKNCVVAGRNDHYSELVN